MGREKEEPAGKAEIPNPSPTPVLPFASQHNLTSFIVFMLPCKSLHEARVLTLNRL